MSRSTTARAVIATRASWRDGTRSGTSRGKRIRTRRSRSSSSSAFAPRCSRTRMRWGSGSAGPSSGHCSRTSSQRAGWCGQDPVGSRRRSPERLAPTRTIGLAKIADPTEAPLSRLAWGGAMKRVLTLIAVFSVTLLLGAPSAAGTMVWVVDNDGADCQRADFATIQAAVTAAAPGDTILVCAGIYHERVSITTSEITLRAKGAPGDVTVDADLLGHGILITGAHGVTIEGFTVREGHDNDIFLVNANGNTIRENILTAAVHDPLELFNSDDNLIEHNLSVDNLGANAC